MPWNNITSYVTGQKVTAAVWEDMVENMNFLEEVAYQEFTADVSVTATSVGTAQQIVSAGALTYENVPHVIRFECPAVLPGSANEIRIIVRDGTTVLGTLARVALTGLVIPVHREYRLTPTAASHTYNIAAWNSAAVTSVFNAGTGGAAGDGTTDFAGFIRITRIPT